ncbi:MAG TPA: tetratricopeptide repeat protein [Opitutaceae bacterium]|nr:tetratricopeptide repeat protein [Opitutaceae bacterium]
MRISGGEKFRRAAPWAMVALVLGVVLACYWPAFHGELLWDDPAHITSEELRSWTGLWRIWFDLGATQQYYPVLHTTFWIEHRLWGDSMFGYHLANAVLHAACCCLLAMILRRLWMRRETEPGSAGVRGELWGFEWLAALLFAAHPVCVESVAWISEQKNTLSLLFYLLAGLVYLQFDARRQRRSYLLATCLFLLAMGTKTVTATLPAAILVVLWWRNGSLAWRRDVLPLVPWFAAAAVMGLLTAWVEETHIGARGASFELSAMERVLLASRVVWFYLGNLVWPADLTFFYPRWDVAAEAPSWIGYLLAGISVTVVFFLFRHRSRGPLATWLLFVGSLFPALGFFNVYPFVFSYVADHFQYLPCLVFIAAAVGGIATVASRATPWVRAGTGLIFGVLLFGLIHLSREQSRLYQDMETLFGHTVARVPQSWMAHHNLGLGLSLSPGESAGAIAAFRKAIELNPEFPNSHFALGRELLKRPDSQMEAIGGFERALQLSPNYPEANNALGKELAMIPGRLEEAIGHLETAVSVRPRNAEYHLNFANALAMDPAHLPKAMAHFEETLHIRPDYARAQNDYGLVLAKLPGREAEATRRFEEALRLDPKFAEAHFNLANTLAAMPGRASEAISYYNRALTIDPESAPAHYGLANVLARESGRWVEAVEHYESALRLHPEFAEAHANLANVLVRMPGRLADAIAHYESALRIDPSLAWVHFNLALHLAQFPDHAAEAAAHYEKALKIKPDYLDALNGLAILFAQQGRYEDARTRWMEALELDPGYQKARENLRLLEQMTSKAK